MSAASESPVVRFREVGKVYDDEGLRVTAVKSVTFDIPRKRFAMILGPSGSGKTTLLNLIGCIDMLTSGRLEMCGQDVGALGDWALTEFRSRNIAFVFQNFNLLPVLTAYENVEIPLLLLGMRTSERRDQAMAMLESVGLADKREHRPNQLSGGQRQRVAIARALVKGWRWCSPTNRPRTSIAARAARSSRSCARSRRSMRRASSSPRTTRSSSRTPTTPS